MSIFNTDWFLWKLISGSSQARFVHWVWKVLERKSRRSSMSQRLLSSYWHCFRSIWAQWTYNHQEQFSSHYGWGERQSLQMRLRRWTLRPTWPTKTRSSWLTLRRWTGNTLLRYFTFSTVDQFQLVKTRCARWLRFYIHFIFIWPNSIS